MITRRCANPNCAHEFPLDAARTRSKTCSWNGVEYPSITAMSNALGITFHVARKRVRNGWKSDDQLPKPREVVTRVDGDVIHFSLTRGYTATINIIDVDLLERKWLAMPDRSGNVYVACNLFIRGGAGKRQILRIHRLIMERVVGRELAPGELVDHIDRNALNNTRVNLRIATNAQNQHNRGKQSDNTSGYKGVFWHRHAQRWKAVIRVNGKRLWLGSFSTPELAHQAYCAAAAQYRGEFGATE